MTSKEFIEWEMLGCSYNKNKYYKQVIKDLERLEKQDKILEILKPYFSGSVFPSAIFFNFNNEELNLLKKEWLNDK